MPESGCRGYKHPAAGVDVTANPRLNLGVFLSNEPTPLFDSICVRLNIRLFTELATRRRIVVDEIDAISKVELLQQSMHVPRRDVAIVHVLDEREVNDDFSERVLLPFGQTLGDDLRRLRIWNPLLSNLVDEGIE